MSIETRIIRTLIGWLWKRYQFLMMDVVIPKDAHVHKNPRKVKVAP